MPEQQDNNFSSFLSQKLKDRNLTVKKISELSGITEKHLELLLSGDFRRLPAAPYVRGYIGKLGEVLDFEGAAWWEVFKKEQAVRVSGPRDRLPQNRFSRASPLKLIGIGIVVVALFLYFGFRAPKIFGEPELQIATPGSSSSVMSQEDITLSGTLIDGDKVFINGERVSLEKDGSWQKRVMLHSGLNVFKIEGEKLLGGKVEVLRQVIYEVPQSATTTATTTTPQPSKTPGAGMVE